METRMIDLINSDLKRFTENANKLDVDEFTSSVYASFTGAKFEGALSYKHYAILVPVDLAMYYDNEQHMSFEKYGYYQGGSPERYRNLFFATKAVVDEMVGILKYEGMTIDTAFDSSSNQTVFVVTRDGIANSNYLTDYPNEKEK